MVARRGTSNARPPHPCEVKACPVIGTTRRGMCGTHYSRWRRTGDPLSVNKRTLMGEDALRWKGDTVSYFGMHSRIQEQWGKASEYVCTCGAPAQDWAYDNTDPDEKVGPRGMLFSTNVERYEPLCRRCHKMQDIAALVSRTEELLALRALLRGER